MMKFRKAMRRFVPIVAKEFKKDDTISERFSNDLIEGYSDRLERYRNEKFGRRDQNKGKQKINDVEVDKNPEIDF